MFPRISVVFVTALLAMAMFAVATPLTTTEPAGQCNTGTLQCCNRVGKGSELGVGGFLSLLGLAVNSLVGLTCSVGGPTCSQQPVCCTGNDFNGVIVVGCSPINLHL